MFLFKVAYEFWAQTSLTLIKVCYLFVVIQYSVHVFDPDGINRAIKQDPFSVGCRAGGIFSESIGQDTWKNYQSMLEYLLSKYQKRSNDICDFYLYGPTFTNHGRCIFTSRGNTYFL